MIPIVPNASVCLHDRTRGDLTMADVSREGDEQFAGQRDDRNAADPAALRANAVAEPTTESTGRLVSHPHPSKLDHCGAQTRITGLRDTLFLVDAATLPGTSLHDSRVDALASSKRSGKSTGCWPRTPSVARERVFRSRLRHYGDGIVPLLRSVVRAHFIDCGFDARRTSHPVAVPKNGWHHNPSFAGSSGSGGRVHPVCRHITATVCDGPPARIQRG